MSKAITLDRTMTWINKTQGRDKFCKAIQYACRFLKLHAEQKGDKELALKYNGLFTGMRDARKLFRLFKSINQYQKLLELLRKKGVDDFDRILQVITRIGFLCYWFFDNIAILSTIKVLKRDAKWYNKMGSTCWFIALFSTLVLTIKELVSTSENLKVLRIQTYFPSEEERAKNIARRKELETKRFTQILNLIKTLGDLVPASQGSEILPNIAKVNANDKQIGLGGFISAVITSYQLYE